MATQSHSLEEGYNLPKDGLDGSHQDLEKFENILGIYRAENPTGHELVIHFETDNSELFTAVTKIALNGGYQIWRLDCKPEDTVKLRLIPPSAVQY